MKFRQNINNNVVMSQLLQKDVTINVSYKYYQQLTTVLKKRSTFVDTFGNTRNGLIEYVFGYIKIIDDGKRNRERNREINFKIPNNPWCTYVGEFSYGKKSYKVGISYKVGNSTINLILLIHLL